MVKCKPFCCDSIRQKFLSTLAELGLEPLRVDLLPLIHLNHDHMQAYSLMDIRSVIFILPPFHIIRLSSIVHIHIDVVSRFINIYVNVDNARKSYNMKRREYIFYPMFKHVM